MREIKCDMAWPLFSDEFFMNEALREAEKAFRTEEVPVGAVIVAANRIIARAHNQTEMLNDVTAHAEMIAFTAAAGAIGGKYLQDCTLFVTVEPCPMCAGAAYWTQIGRIVYGTKDPKRGFSLLMPVPLHPATQVKGGVLEHECAQLMKEFFRGKRD